MARVLDLIDGGDENVYKVDVPLGMRWMQQAWEELPGRVTINSWKLTKLVGEFPDSSTKREVREEKAAPDEDISDVVTVSVERMQVWILLNHESEHKPTETITEKDSVEYIANKGADDGKENDFSDTDCTPSLSRWET